jgi:hypothetical protein
MPQESVTTPFDVYLDAGEPLEGLRDFGERLPSLFLNRMTGVGTAVQSGFAQEDASKAGRTEEVDGNIVYFRYRLYFAVEGVEVRTRVEEPSGSRGDREDLRRFLEDPRKIGAEIHDPERFSRGVLVDVDGDVVVRTSLKEGDKAEGEVRPYWVSYWVKVGRPVVNWVIKLVRERKN